MLKKWFTLDEKYRFALLASANMALRYALFIILGIITGINHYQITLILSWILSSFIAFYSYKILDRLLAK